MIFIITGWGGNSKQATKPKNHERKELHILLCQNKMSLVKDTINKVKRQATGMFCNLYNSGLKSRLLKSFRSIKER